MWCTETNRLKYTLHTCAAFTILIGCYLWGSVLWFSSSPAGFIFNAYFTFAQATFNLCSFARRTITLDEKNGKTSYNAWLSSAVYHRCRPEGSRHAFTHSHNFFHMGRSGVKSLNVTFTKRQPKENNAVPDVSINKSINTPTSSPTTYPFFLCPFNHDIIKTVGCIPP